ncbi:MAG: hypothetical protein A2Z25_01660 [Planctomycetes bacterium RBG_16_55_9]|nr:MAG: hypothetical protein A2Z25_01660 [Planctomycetes bacterium RBG_16_55_9]
MGAEKRAVLSGDLKKWHTVTLTFDGPQTGEDAEPNPFLDYRLNVTFMKGNKQYVVPGYYAADGDAAETSAKAGSKWRVHFVPDEEGRWSFDGSFRTGSDIALSSDPSAGVPTPFDGVSGRFEVGPTDKMGRDHRAKGRLQYVGEHYLKFAETGEYYLKGGADSPENFLAYADFDDTYDASADSGSYKEVGTFIHRYEPHVRDWKPGDPTWKNGKGKGMIGALNYLASKGMNSVYFLTYNLDGGDGRDTWTWTTSTIRDRFDCSKLDQWEIVFSHTDRLGIMLHVVTQETENDRRLGGSAGLNPIRRLYYRELVARFGHHLAVMWNLGEENNTPDKDRKEIAAYIRALDPYDHPITVHTHNNQSPKFYQGILGDSCFEASSIQSDLDRYYRDAVELRRLSAEAGRKWAIFGDEQAPASHGVLPDADDPNHEEPRKLALWGNLMGGGSGVEWYFGHRFAHMDINCEDWRSRDVMWDQTRYALEFFHTYLPFWQMAPADTLVSAQKAYCFAKPGQVYAIYLPASGTTNLDLGNSSSTFTVQWYNPRTGGHLQTGKKAQITGPGQVAIGQPPSEGRRTRDEGRGTNDWVALIKRK